MKIESWEEAGKLIEEYKIDLQYSNIGTHVIPEYTWVAKVFSNEKIPRVICVMDDQPLVVLSKLMDKFIVTKSS